MKFYTNMACIQNDMKYIEFKTHLNGQVTFYKKDDGTYHIAVTSGFLNGQFPLSDEEFKRLKTFLREVDK